MAGEMLASAIVKQVAGKLCSEMCKEVDLVWGLKKSLKEMESTFSTLVAVLEDAEWRSISNRPLCDWLKKLKDAAYDVDDLLNEYQANLDNDDEEKREGGLNSICSCILDFFSLSNPLVFRCDMAHRMKTIRERLDNIASDRIQFHLQESSSVSERRRNLTETNTTSERETFSEIDESMIYGSRHEDREKIVSFLLESGEEEVVGVIPIVGLGGMGKTTVAQLAFNDERVKKHACFDPRIWVYVSMDFDLNRVARAIISSDPGASCDLQNLESMKNCIKNLVKGKRFLVVLDDVWTEDDEKWGKLKLLLRGGARGSKIIVTTRSESVASRTGTVASHCLKGLTDDECWGLIKRRAFKSGDEERSLLKLVVIGMEIAKKCAGVPLAANALGTMLRSKQGEETWSAIRDSKNWEVDDAQDRVLSSLKLSYYEMPAELKQCFAYCSIFPKGSEIDKDKLIHQWISLGFIQSKDATFPLMEEKGNEYINILFWMSFLQDPERFLGERGCCKMHDLVHDLARSVAAGDVSVVETQKEARDVKECRYASLAGCDGPSEVPKRLLKKVRALHFRGDESMKMKLPDSTFSHATSLRALHLEGCRFDELPTSIGMLKQLRYLDAPYLRGENGTKIFQFPKNLQVLNLSKSSILSLPESIGNISKLHHLDLSSCCELQGLPASIGNLQNLHHLDLSYCSMLQDLPESIGNLQNLHHLDLSYCMNLQDLPPNIPSPIHLNYFPKLETLFLQGCYSISSWPTEIFDSTNLKHLKVLQNFSSLSTFIECGGKHISTEELEHQNRTGNELEIFISIERMDHPRDARRVDISKKQNVRSLVLRAGYLRDEYILYSLHYLRDQYIYYLVDEFMTRVVPYLSPHPNLKVLTLDGYMGRSFPSWMIDSKELRLQNLVELTLEDVTVEDHLPSLGHLPSLEVLRLKGMRNVEYLSCDAQYPSLKELEFEHMNSLGKWTTATVVDNGKQSCEVFLYPRLEKLTIKGCPLLMPQPCLPASVIEMAVGSSCEAILSCEWRTGPSSSLMSSSASSSSSSSTTLLKTLYISGVRSVNGWKGLSHHTALEELTIEDCCDMDSLPDSIQGLTCLRSLNLSFCWPLRSLPAWLGSLTSLQSLKISECPRLTVSRDIMKGLTSLRTLKISKCPNQELLGDISSLQVEISACQGKCNYLALLERPFSKFEN